MPAYTLGDVMSFITSDAGRRADVPASVASRIANEAYFEVAFQTDPQERELCAVSSTTTGEAKIELPTDFLEPVSMTLFYQPSWSTSSSAYSSYYTLRIISPVEYDSKNPQPSGVPREAAFFNSWVELYPSPNSGYSFMLRYISGVTDLLETTQVPSLSTPWRPAWKMKAQEKLFAYLGDETREFNLQQQYLQYVSMLKTDTARRQSTQLRTAAKPHWGVGGRRRV